MSLKRKASFPTIVPPQPTQNAIDRMFIDDSPKHLHCRTRKRVRNDRPDDQTIYENTLRWLYTAQQRSQQIPTPPSDREEDMEPTLEPPTAIVDPRQQTLLRFFRPVQPSQPRSASTPMSHTSSGTSCGSTGFMQCHDIGGSSPLSGSENGTSRPAQMPGGDMNMDVDMDT
ncbi:hypothetical protein BJX61DRAFT_175146 [Aspergillus egyptiacus]|nr:hypothetical protein BJX61DRAFT_175146 [Aspergillus egyptiacus]